MRAWQGAGKRGDDEPEVGEGSSEGKGDDTTAGMAWGLEGPGEGLGASSEGSQQPTGGF